MNILCWAGLRVIMEINIHTNIVWYIFLTLMTLHHLLHFLLGRARVTSVTMQSVIVHCCTCVRKALLEDPFLNFFYHSTQYQSMLEIKACDIWVSCAGSCIHSILLKTGKICAFCSFTALWKSFLNGSKSAFKSIRDKHHVCEFNLRFVRAFLLFCTNQRVLRQWSRPNSKNESYLETFLSAKHGSALWIDNKLVLLMLSLLFKNSYFLLHFQQKKSLIDETTIVIFYINLFFFKKFSGLFIKFTSVWIISIMII